MIIRYPLPELSTAENILRLLRTDGEYSDLEAKVLDVALILHAEHGGGNNSTFSTHVISSTGTDTYSAIAASLGSLTGPRHGGANVKVQDFYSGFVYSMLRLPKELFTAIFAIARISGWCAHRIEELVNAGKIIRPAYKYVGEHKTYAKMSQRGMKKEPGQVTEGEVAEKTPEKKES